MMFIFKNQYGRIYQMDNSGAKEIYFSNLSNDEKQMIYNILTNQDSIPNKKAEKSKKEHCCQKMNQDPIHIDKIKDIYNKGYNKDYNTIYNHENQLTTLITDLEVIETDYKQIFIDDMKNPKPFEKELIESCIHNMTTLKTLLRLHKKMITTKKI